jgi:hypothetical protein|tara:strand:- start:178 stop:459 length:282 start_codon:yes stop_codon:yes gene_type:complete
MKKLIVSLSLFSILFTFLTFLNYQLEILDSKLEAIEIKNKKLEYDLNFIKAEWGYVNSPKNISLLVKSYFNHKPANLIEIDDFVNIVLSKEKK